MKTITMPLPPIMSLNLPIDIKSFIHQYMSFADEAITAINGTPLYYNVCDENYVGEDRLNVEINLTRLPSIASTQAHFKFDFIGLLLDGINNHKLSGTQDFPTASPELIIHGDMRAWPKAWISAYFWFVIKLTFADKFALNPFADYQFYLTHLVATLCEQDYPATDTRQAIEIQASPLKSHLDAAAYRDILCNLKDTILNSELIANNEQLHVTNMFGFGISNYEPISGTAMNRVSELQTSLFQAVKEDDTFFEPNQSMRTLKIPTPSLSSLGIECDHQTFAESFVLFMSELIRCYNETRLHYNNVRVVDDAIYADINLTRFPKVYLFESAFFAIIKTINHNPLSGKRQCPPFNADILEDYDARLWCDAWLSYALIAIMKAYYIKWHKKPATMTDDDFFADMVARMGGETKNRATLEDVKQQEAIEIINDYGVDSNYATILTDFSNEIIAHLKQAQADHSDTMIRSIDEDAIETLLDKYTDMLMYNAAEYLWYLRLDDDAIKADDYYM